MIYISWGMIRFVGLTELLRRIPLGISMIITEAKLSSSVFCSVMSRLKVKPEAQGTLPL